MHWDCLNNRALIYCTIYIIYMWVWYLQRLPICTAYVCEYVIYSNCLPWLNHTPSPSPPPPPPPASIICQFPGPVFARDCKFSCRIWAHAMDLAGRYACQLIADNTTSLRNGKIEQYCTMYCAVSEASLSLILHCWGRVDSNWQYGWFSSDFALLESKSARSASSTTTPDDPPLPQPPPCTVHEMLTELPPHTLHYSITIAWDAIYNE